MKKILFFIFIFILKININYAITLESIDLPYYVKIKDISNNTESIVKVKKVYEKDSANPVFNINYNYDDLHTYYTKYDTYSTDIWKRNNNFYNQFSTIVYYGYNLNQNDFNYYITQAIIWNYHDSWQVTLVNELGVEEKNYNIEFNNKLWLITSHYLQSNFFYKTYERELWQTDKFTYLKDSVILDNPDSDAFKFNNINNDLYITTIKPGKYKLFFKKEYEKEIYCYSDGNSVYWQSLKGPANLSQYLTYIVSASKFKINDVLIGVNNRYGDAFIDNSLYEIYYNDEKKYQISINEEVYLNNNSDYLIKDISTNDSINNIDDYQFTMNENDYVLNITKYIVCKNITFNINNENKYYVYLKSNNELYETIDKDNYLITLPYGIYYIKDESNNYVDELIIHDSIDVTVDIQDSDDIPSTYENQNNELEYVVNDIIEEEKVVNPQTGINIDNYIINTIIYLLLMIIGIIKYRNII